MNYVAIIGNLTADPEIRTTNGGASVGNFTVAVRRGYKNQQGEYDSDFLPVQVWKGTADYCGKYLKKGMRVAVEGSVQVRTYTAKDGSKRYATEIIARNVENLTPKQASPADISAAEKAAAALMGEGFAQVEDSELPF